MSKETDIAVRCFLVQRGMKKGDLSKFIEDAVKWHVLDQTVTEAQSEFSGLAPEDLESLLEKAVSSTRQARIDKAD